MDWQTAIAVGLALLCGIWVLWRWTRPLFSRNAGCDLCDECRESKDRRNLVQIAPPDRPSLH